MKNRHEEQALQRAILYYLNKIPYCFAWKAQTGGVYDPRRKVWRKNFGGVGVADIIGLYRGRFFAFECKSKRGKLTPRQEEFLTRVRACEGIALMVKSIEEVVEAVENLLGKRYDDTKI